MSESATSQFKRRHMDPTHPYNRFPDETIKSAIERSISHCNQRISVYDVIVEILDGVCVYGLTYREALTDRERQYLSYKIGKILSERGARRERKKVWVVR